MKMSLCRVGVVVGGMFLASSAWADTPNLAGPHGHGEQVSGKITMFRVQQKDIELVVNGDKVDAEVMVQVDSKPEMVYVLPMHDADPARQAITDTLRQAFMNDKLITLEHMIAPGKKVATINWVQFGNLAEKP